MPFRIDGSCLRLAVTRRAQRMRECRAGNERAIAGPRACEFWPQQLSIRLRCCEIPNALRLPVGSFIMSDRQAAAPPQPWR